MLVAHRGLSSLAPENTLASVDLAAQYRIPWVEIDVQLSSDGVPVVIHDESFRRYNGNKKLVRQTSLKEIKQQDVGAWFDLQFTGEKVPTLSEMLDLCYHANLGVNIELKHFPKEDPYRLTQNICNIVKESALPENRIIFSCFSAEIIGLCKEYLPYIRRGYINFGADLAKLEFLRGLELYSIHSYYPRLKPNITENMQAHNILPIIWTLNNPDLARKYYEMGVAAIITDFPQKFLQRH